MVRAVALGVAVVLAALPGEAQERSGIPNASPRDGSVELRLGNWFPRVDEGLASAPFERIYGGHKLLLFEVEVQRFFYQGIGTAGLSVSLGYGEKFGYALTEDGTASEERSGFHVVPLHVRALYRMDYPALHWHIPLVPYIKPGVVYIPWWVTKGTGLETTDTSKGFGGSLGLEVAGGVSLLLDVLEPRLARDFDTDLGINHSYLFAEYTYSKVNNFDRGGLNLSSSYWMFGLALDY